MWAGMLSTAGGVVFTGDDDGNLGALDARTGTDLWHFSTGHSLFASPVTYVVDAHQYVAIAAEDDVFIFGLFEGKSKSLTNHGKQNLAGIVDGERRLGATV